MDRADYAKQAYPAPAAFFALGTQTDQLGVVTQIRVFATTTDANPTVVTGPPPPDGHANAFNGSYSVTDRTAHTASSGNGFGTVKSYNGVASVPGQTWTDVTGDGPLATAAPSVSIGAGNVINVTFTPPAGYVGTLSWEMLFDILRN